MLEFFQESSQFIISGALVGLLVGILVPEYIAMFG